MSELIKKTIASVIFALVIAGIHYGLHQLIFNLGIDPFTAVYLITWLLVPIVAGLTIPLFLILQWLK